MRSRLFIFALLLGLGGAIVVAAPSPSPTPTPKPAPPLKPTGPVKPLQDAAPSPSPSERPTKSRKSKSTPPESPSPSPASSASPSPKASRTKSPPPLKPDAELDVVADEYIRGYLAARPLQATALGFHEYDGRINEDTRLAIDAELARLRRFDDRLSKFDLTKLGPRAAIDLRLLQASVKREFLFIGELGIYEHNPLTYARAIDVGVYAKRKYAPIEDRVRSIVVVENQAGGFGGTIAAPIAKQVMEALLR